MDDQRVQLITGAIATVNISDDIVSYVNELVRSTRNRQEIYLGCSPRAGIALFPVDGPDISQGLFSGFFPRRPVSEVHNSWALPHPSALKRFFWPCEELLRSQSRFRLSL